MEREELVKKVREQFYKVYGEMCSEEDLTKEINKVYKKFTEERVYENYSGEERTELSELSEIIHKELREDIKLRLKPLLVAELDKLDWTDNNGNQILIQLIKECAPELVRALLSDIIDKLGSSIKSAIDDKHV